MKKKMMMDVQERKKAKSHFLRICSLPQQQQEQQQQKQIKSLFTRLD
jgi:hypothetical protein